MAIFARMLQAVRTFLSRPVAEDFRFQNQIWQSLQSGVYVFLFIYLFGGTSFRSNSPFVLSRTGFLALLGVGCLLTTLFANWVVPRLIPALYDEDRWTIRKHILQTLFILLCVSAGNQILLILLHQAYPAFWRMYMSVTLIGFFPILMSVFITEQRRLKRNLAQAQALNEQLARRTDPSVALSVTSSSADVDKTKTAKSNAIVLMSETGKERLILQPNQLLYVESVGNYVDVHWVNQEQRQKTVLRSTLKDIADSLAYHPHFFRSHRAFLVNLKQVSQTEGNARGYQLTLNGVVAKLPVSRGYLGAFDERMAELV